jgi:hypothetical protein
MRRTRFALYAAALVVLLTIGRRLTAKDEELPVLEARRIVARGPEGSGSAEMVVTEEGWAGVNVSGGQGTRTWFGVDAKGRASVGSSVDGVTRTEMYAEKEGTVGLRLADPKGRTRIEAALPGGADPHISLTDVEGVNRMTLRVDDEKGVVAFELRDAKGESLLELLGEDGKTLWTPPVGKPGGR